MMNQTHWADFTVQDFFRDYNWSGEDRRWVKVDGDAEETEVTLHLSLSVADFLQQQNWQGKATPQRLQASAAPLELSLAMPVAEFLGGIPWHGQPAIARAFQQAAPKFSLPEPSPFKLDQFSDLF